MPVVEEGKRATAIGDGLMVVFCSLVAAWLLTEGAWAPGSRQAAVIWACLALGIPFLRGVGERRWRGLAALGRAFWPAPVLVLGHANFGPVVDGITPVIRDAALARIDLSLFGAVPSVLTEPWVPAPLMDLLLLCYYSYFAWPLLVGAAIYRVNRAAYAEYRLAMVLFFILNFALYAAVPAIGPRFFLAGTYQAPLRGWVLTPLLDGLMRVTAFNRDCFPSGHTGFTTVVLVYAAQHARRWFWIMAPVAAGLVAATVIARFHYGVDLLCAVPAVMLAVLGANVLSRPGLTRVLQSRGGGWWRGVEEDAAGR